MGGLFSPITDALFGAPPKPPDYQALADKQMQASRPNQTTPFGFSKWGQDANGNWSQSTGFDPKMQGLFESLQGAASKGLANGIGTGQDAFNQSQGTALNNFNQNMLPQLQQHFDQGRSALINSGADVGSEIYDVGNQSLNRDFSGGLAQGWQAANQQGLNAQNMTYQQNKDAYTTPFSLMGQMQNMLQMPGFQTGGNYQQAGQQQFGAEMQNYNAQQEATTGLLQGAGSIAGAMPFSFGGASAANGFGAEGYGKWGTPGQVVSQGSGDFQYGT